MSRRSVVLLVFLMACGSTPAKPGSLPDCKPVSILSEGESIPKGCSFRTLDGAVMSLADLKGTPVLMNFWATWCPNCIDEMPALQKASTALAGKARIIGFDLLNVDGETVSAARSFVKRVGATYLIVEDADGRLYGHFSARNLLPTTVWADASGVIRHRQFGPLDTKTIVDTVRRYLGVS